MFDTEYFVPCLRLSWNERLLEEQSCWLKTLAFSFQGKIFKRKPTNLSNWAFDSCISRDVIFRLCYHTRRYTWKASLYYEHSVNIYSFVHVVVRNLADVGWRLHFVTSASSGRLSHSRLGKSRTYYCRKPVAKGRDWEGATHSRKFSPSRKSKITFALMQFGIFRPSKMISAPESYIVPFNTMSDYGPVQKCICRLHTTVKINR